MLMLGSEAAPGSSAEFSPKVTTYTLPVPVFGDTSAVEGVLTAARHTAAEGIAGNRYPSSIFFSAQISI